MVGVDGVCRLRDRTRLESEVGITVCVTYSDFKPRLERSVEPDLNVLVDLVCGNVQRSLLQFRERERIVAVAALVEAGQRPRPFLDERGASLLGHEWIAPHLDRRAGRDAQVVLLRISRLPVHVSPGLMRAVVRANLQTGIVMYLHLRTARRRAGDRRYLVRPVHIS